MKFNVNRDHFTNGLAQVLNLISAKATMPILGNVLIEAKAEHVSLTTTNLDLGIRCRIKAVVATPGAVTLPVRRLASIVRELPNLDVTVDSSPGHQVKVSSGGATFRLMGIGPDEFPPVEDDLPRGQAKSYVIPQASLAAMLQSVAHSQSRDETRYILNGIYFNLQNGTLSLVATDGRRLSLISSELDSAAGVSGAFILPAKCVSELSRLLGKGESLKISFTDRLCTLKLGTDRDESGLADDIYLRSKLIEGNFPNYQQVIPKDPYHRAKLGRELFLACAHRASLVCSDKSNSIRLKFATGRMEITAQSPDFGEAREVMDVDYSGQEIEVAFNPAYVMEALRAVAKDEVFFEVKDSASPGVLKTADTFVCVVMPVRLN